MSVDLAIWRKQKAEAQSRYRASHPDRCKKSRAAWYKKNRVEVLAATRTDEFKAHRNAVVKNSRDKNPKSLLVMQAKNRAKKKGLPFDLSTSDFEIPEKCPALGIILKRGKGKLADSSPTLDRFDNNKGYIKGNVFVLSWRANRMKGDATLEELKQLVAWIEATRAY